jgi:hypothetical protein
MDSKIKHQKHTFYVIMINTHIFCFYKFFSPLFEDSITALLLLLYIIIQ